MVPYKNTLLLPERQTSERASNIGRIVLERERSDTDTGDDDDDDDGGTATKRLLIYTAATAVAD